MIRINLLPSEIHIAEVRKQLSVAGGVLAGLIVLSMLGFLGTRYMRAHKLEQELTQANDELRKYQAIVDQVNQLEQTRNQLRARRDVIQQLLKGRLVYPKFFEDMMALLPAEIWLTNIATSPDPKEPGSLNVSFSAKSTSNFSIADWITNLQKSPYCSNVELGGITSQESDEGKATVLSFSIRLHYARGDV